MIHLVLQIAGRSVDQQIRVDAPVRITGMLPMKESRDAVALQAAVFHFFRQHEIAPADRVAPMLQITFQRLQDLNA